MNLHSLTFDGSGGGWSMVDNITTTGDFNVLDGSVTAPSGTLIVGGSFANSGTFNANNGTTTLNGTSQQILSGSMVGSNAFYKRGFTQKRSLDVLSTE